MTYTSHKAIWFGLANILLQCSEELYEKESFPQRELAALVTAKVYYQLQEYNESMVFALAAGKLFDLDHPGEFEETILGISYLYAHSAVLDANVCICQQQNA